MQIVNLSDRLATALADLFNRSDRGWPGGLVRGIPKTQDHVRQQQERIASIGDFAAMEGDRMVGFVRLFEWWASSDATYVSWLNVDPEHHGRGIGRALVLRCIERTVELGYPRIDLHTWPGNDRAMPLYKRTGFKWSPGSAVYMQNYIPLLLRYPAARPFFERHDWYRTLRASVKSVEDNEKLDGTSGYRYTWRAKAESLSAWIDARARDVMAVETDDYRVSFRVKDGTLVAGLPSPVEWRVRNKASRPLPVSIRSVPSPKVDFKAAFSATIPPRASRVFKADAVASSALRAPPEDLASHSLAAEVVVGDVVHPLRASFAPEPAVSISLARDDLVLPPMQRRKVRVRVANNARRPLRGTLRVRGTGLVLPKKEFSMRLGKGGKRVLDLVVDNPSGSPRLEHLEFSWSGTDDIGIEESIPIPCLPPGGAVAYVHKDEAILVSSRLRIVAALYSGNLAVSERPTGEKVVESLHHALGPPFIPAALDKVWWEAEVPGSGLPEVVLRARDPGGLTIAVTVALRGDNALELRREVANPGDRDRTTDVWLGMRRAFDEPTVAFATKSGPVEASTISGDFPEVRGDLPERRFLAEGWFHAASPDTGFALAWRPEEVDEFWATPWTTAALVSKGVRVPARGVARLSSVHLLAPSRDWQEARQLWLHIAGKDAPSPPPRELHPLLEARVRPSLPVAGEAVMVRIANQRGQTLEGSLELDLPRGINARPPRVRVPPTDWQRPFAGRFRLAGRSAGLHAGVARLHTPRGTREWPLAALVPRGTVRVTHPAREVVLDNGVLRARIAPGFSASLHSLRWRGREVLHSSYPKAGSLSWIRPFYGGVLPYAIAHGWISNMDRERFRASRVARGPWRGVRLDATAAKSDLPKGLRLGVEHLMVPGVSLLATSFRLENPTREEVDLRGGVFAFLAPGGLDTTAEFDLGGWRTWEPKITSADAWTDGGPVVVHRKGRAPFVALVAPGERVGIADFGVAGRHVFLERRVHLPPGGARRFLLFIVPAATRNEAAATQILRNVGVEDFARDPDA